MPLIVTGAPVGSVAPSDGDWIVDTGGVVSDDGLAGMSPAASEPGCTAMSANRLTVACCISTLAGGPLKS